MAVILAVRTYAVWIRDKRVGIGLALLSGFFQIPYVIILYRFIQGVVCECLRSTFVAARVRPLPLDTQNPYPEIYRGCAYDTATRVIYVNWVILTIVEGGTLSTTQL